MRGEYLIMKKKINVVIINGKPRSGKDTVIKYMKTYCDINECANVYSYSTIDPVKDMLKKLGWDGEKTPDVRNLLAQLKQFWVNNCDGPFKYCMDIVMSKWIREETDDCILVFQIREPAEIEKLVNALKPMQRAYNISVSTLFVNRFLADEETHGNSADTDVNKYKYDAVIYNNGTLIQLEGTVCEYMDNLLKEDK